MEDIKTPYIEDGLLQYLERLFPDVAPEPSQTDREIWINRGAAGVVRHIKMLHKEQRNNILGDIQDVHGK
jgi:hypothetical protein